MENVDNLVRHDKDQTFKIIIDKLERQLDYQVIGVAHNNDQLKYEGKDFIRNSKNFGVPPVQQPLAF